MPERHDEPSMARQAVVDLRDTSTPAGRSKVLCSRDHPNKPENARCFICGEFLRARHAPRKSQRLPPPPPPPPPAAARQSELPPPPPPPPRVLEGRGR